MLQLKRPQMCAQVWNKATRSAKFNLKLTVQSACLKEY